MLSHIYIRNFAIIREIDLDLSEGLNIITGETGTGKSIVIQAVSTALGGRGSASYVADGCDKATVQLVFSLSAEEKALLAAEFDYILEDSEEDLILSRDFHASGKSIARINGRIVNLSVLSEISAHLADIHGQYDNQKLLNPASHLKILDRFAGPDIIPLRRSLAKTYEKYQNVRRSLIRLRKDHSEYLRRRDFLRYECDEIDAAALREGEDSELEQRLALLQNGEKIYKNLEEAYDILYANSLSRCVALLSEIDGYDASYASFTETVQNCMYTLQDICDEIRRARDQVTFSPEAIDETMERLDLIEKLRRKYGGSIADILAYRAKISGELDLIENIDDRESDLEKQLGLLRAELDTLSSALTDIRRKAAEEMSREMTRQLTELNFKNAVFSVRITPAVNSEGRRLYSAEGSDTVEFLFNANRRGELKPLAEVASGGEISRISLAFKCLTKESSASCGAGTTGFLTAGTMIFDEIDTGISGITASIVGRKMSELAEHHQILCITHLPQIAAAGDHQYLISKGEDGSGNYTTLRRLTEQERIAELARLLGGTNVTQTTLASAAELLQSSKNPNRNPAPSGQK